MRGASVPASRDCTLSRRDLGCLSRSYVAPTTHGSPRKGDKGTDEGVSE